MTTTAKAPKPHGDSKGHERNPTTAPRHPDANTSKLGAVETALDTMMQRSGHNPSNHSGSMGNHLRAAAAKSKRPPRPQSLRDAGQIPFGGTPPAGSPFSEAGAAAPPEPMGAGPEGPGVPGVGAVPPPGPLGQ